MCLKSVGLRDLSGQLNDLCSSLLCEDDSGYFHSFILVQYITSTALDILFKAIMEIPYRNMADI